MLGRGAERERARRALATTDGGRMAVVTITGEAGIGKSCLVEVAADEARAAGFEVIDADADALDVDRPFGVVRDALDAGHRATPAAALAIGDSLLAELEDRVRTPTLLILEDLHHADAASLRFVRDIARGLADLPLALFVTGRTAGANGFDRLVGDLSRRGADTIALGPLDDASVRELAALVAGAECGPELAALLSGVAGNPLFVIELVSALREDGALHLDGGVIDIEPGSHVIVPGLRATLRRRLAGVALSTVDLLSVASVLGASFSPAELALVLGRPVVTLLRDLRAAVAAGVLREAGGHLEFSHHLVREALYADLDARARAALHQEVAGMLEQVGAGRDRVVAHVLRAVTDAAGADRLLALAGDLNADAPALAGTLLERALEILPMGDARRDRAAAELVVPLVLQGRASDAVALAREVLAAPHDPSVDGALLEGLAFAVLRRESPATHRRELETSLERVGLGDRERQLLRGFLAEARFMTGDGAGAAALAEEVRQVAVARGDDELHVQVLGTLAWAAASEGHVDRALALAGEAVRRREAVAASRFNVDIHLGVTLLEADELAEANTRLRRGLRYDLARGDRAASAYYHFGLAGCAYACGDWDDAVADAETGIALIDDGIAPVNVGMFGRALLARIALHRDDLETADVLITEAETALATDGPQFGGDLVLWVRALLLEAAGDTVAAADVLRLEWDAMAGMRYFLSWRSVAPDLVRLLLAAGDDDGAAAVAGDAAEGARRAVGIRSAEAAARRCEGLVMRHPAHLVDAVELYGKSPRVVDLAWAEEDAGAALAASGAVDDGAALLRSSLERFDRLGAAHDGARVAARLKALGATGPARAARPRCGWESLTPTESRVVALVAEGLTNRQIADELFLSRYTVETHVKHVFAKLGLASRVDLTRAAHARTAAE